MSGAQRREFSVQGMQSSVQSPASRVQHLESSGQSPASRVQHLESNVQSPPSRVHRPESSVQSPASSSCVQSPGIPVCLYILYSNLRKKQAFSFSKRNCYTNTCLKFLCDAKLITSLLTFLISSKKLKAVYLSFH